MLLAVLLAVLPARLSRAQVPTSDSLALVALYNATDGANWTNNTNWLTGPVSTWHGVTVIGNRVIHLVLINNQLSGSIPVELGNLSTLNALQLAGNELSGSIPVELGALTNLTQLYLHSNQLSGSIPVELGDLSNLTNLFLGSNQLSGIVPLAVAQLGATIACGFTPNEPSLCIPDTPPYQAIGVDPICGLPLSSTCVPPPPPVTRYVATTGNDTGNDCTNPATPCATISHAVDIANPGDTLDVDAGTYIEAGLVIDKALHIERPGVIVK
ncbi:MAG TPA: hypothetical protein VKP65_04070 [Rhodothermales bacterium]|nr:hypothetical protein [Rhodothermales bacterium]